MSRSLLSRWIALVLLLALWLPQRAPAASSSSQDTISGTYPGRVLGEILRHRQATLQRNRLGYQTQSIAPAAAADVGEIAVLVDDGTLVTTANSFDLDQKNLLFVPVPGGYTVQAGAGGFDAAAASQGILLNPFPSSNPQNIGDDGTRELSIGFSFPFFGGQYNSLFVNSDGNLTFLSGDAASTARSLGRFLGGAPRIAPYFADLDPSIAGQLTYQSSPTRFVVTWIQVPDYASAGIGPRETFQVSLTPDGRIQFSYSGINGREAVVGISPGSVTNSPEPQDLGSASGGVTLPGAIAEVFTPTTDLDLVAVAQRFYQTHEDTYQILFVFTTFDFNLGGAFAFEINIANDVTGIGPIGNAPTFDFSNDFGSERLESMLNMGNLSKYPSDPSQVFLRGVDSTLSVMGQESGHRFLTYIRWRDPETEFDSTALLGRDLQHWSYYFNSDASVMEGNRIRDNGNGTFTTIGAVQHYNDFDQYIMGLRTPEEVSPSFLVKQPSISLNAGAAPSSQQITFSGHRVDVTVDDVIAANGPRIPNSVTARKRYNYAFILVTPRGTQPTDSQVAHLDRIRSDWEGFYEQATSFRSTASTSLLRSLQISPRSLGLTAGSQQPVNVELVAATGIDLTVQISNSNPAAASAPSQVVIPAGNTHGMLTITGLNAGESLTDGQTVVSATAPGFETADLIIQVADPQTVDLSFAIAGGNHQIAPPGSLLPQPLRVSLSDSNRIAYGGQNISFAVVEGDASVNPGIASTDSTGQAIASVQLGSATGPVTIRASVPGTSLTVDFSATALAPPQVPALGITNAASFLSSPVALPNEAASSPGSLISIFGTNLSAETAWAASLPLPTLLGGTTVEIGGIAAPLLYVSPLQINTQVPFELLSATHTLKVRNAAGESTPVSILVQEAFPGIFTFDSSGSGPGAVLHNLTQQPVGTQNPAVPGEFIQVFATGLGAVSPAVTSGHAAGSEPPSETNLPATVTINGTPALVTFSGLAPGFAGLYQVNAEVPAIQPGDAELILTIDGVNSQTVTIPIGGN
jgi:uncharacterized protein (TIGR03437 family)